MNKELDKAFRRALRGFEDMLEGDATEADYTERLEAFVSALRGGDSFEVFGFDKTALLAARNPEFSRFARDTMTALMDAGLQVTDDHVIGAVNANDPEFLTLVLDKADEGLTANFAKVGYATRGTVLQMATSHKHVASESERTDEAYLKSAAEVAQIMIDASLKSDAQFTLNSLNLMKDNADLLPSVREKILETLEKHKPQSDVAPVL